MCHKSHCLWGCSKLKYPPLSRQNQTIKQAVFTLPRLKPASALGLVLGSVLTLIIAGKMGGQGSHFAGTPVADTLRLPIVGWVLSGGDLRIPHFFATHFFATHFFATHFFATHFFATHFFATHFFATHFFATHFFATHFMLFLPLYGLWLQQKNMHYDVEVKQLFIFSAIYVNGLPGIFGVMLWQ